MNKNEVTYDELNKMVDGWNGEMKEYEKIFANQSEAMNNLYTKISSNNEKVTAVGYKVCILNHMNEQLDKDLKSVVLLVEKFEKVILNLQSIVVMIQGTDPLDILRERIYGLAEIINRGLFDCQVDVDLLTDKNQEIIKPKAPVEKVAKIMQTMLQNLEYLETKMEQTKQHINWIHNECRRIITTS